MKQRVTVIGGGVVGLATAYALVREGWSVDLIEARDNLASATSFANGGQLSYRYVAPLADAEGRLPTIFQAMTAQAQGRTFSRQWTFLRKDGQRRQVRLSISRMDGADGERHPHAGAMLGNGRRSRIGGAKACGQARQQQTGIAVGISSQQREESEQQHRGNQHLLAPQPIRQPAAKQRTRQQDDHLVLE